MDSAETDRAPSLDARERRRRRWARAALRALAGLAGVLLALAAGAVLLRMQVRRVGADVDRDYLCVPRPGMWQADERIGYVNRPHVVRRAFGDVVGRTNGAGFRSAVEIPAERVEGTYRVFGLGDSVMWGTRVDEEDSFLGLLRPRLGSVHGAVEVVNAGVVGYSTYQQRLFLEERLLPYRPDLVVVNFCDNDMLPTEDPFGTARRVYVQYLEGLRAGSGPEPLDADELATVDALLVLLRGAPRVWSAIRRADLDEQTLVRLLVAMPMTEMGRLAEQHGFRLLYVFLPSARPTPRQREIQLALQEHLRRAGVEVLDLFDALREEPVRTDQRPASPLAGLFAWHQRSGLRGALAASPLAEWDPVVSLQRIGKYRAFRRRHSERMFIDDLGHPSERGHRIVAERILAHLAAPR